MLATLIKDRFDRWEQQLEQAAAETEDPLERLRAFARAYLDFGMSDPAFFRGAFLERPELIFRVMGKERISKSFVVLEDALQNAVAKGAIRPCNLEATGNALWAAMHGLVTLVLTIPRFSPEQVKEMVDRVIELNVDGLR